MTVAELLAIPRRQRFIVLNAILCACIGATVCCAVLFHPLAPVDAAWSPLDTIAAWLYNHGVRTRFVNGAVVRAIHNDIAEQQRVWRVNKYENVYGDEQAAPRGCCLKGPG
jgi:hypothetical protein